MFQNTPTTQTKRDEKDSLEKVKQPGGPQLAMGAGSVSNILTLQKMIGNRATAQLMQRMQANSAQASASNSHGTKPIQRMSKQDFEAQLGQEMNIQSRMKLGPEIMKFKMWLEGTLDGQLQNQNIVEYIEDDSFTAEKLTAFITEYKSFHKAIGPEIAQNKVADVPIPQGMYLVASQNDLTAGLYTDGASPCVIVGFHAKVSDDGSTDVLALAHFDGQTDPEMLTTMYEAVVARLEADTHPPITIYLSGGAGKKGGDEQAELTGFQLFTKLEALADGIASSAQNVKVQKRRSVDGKDVSARLDAAKGMKRYKSSLINHKDSDQLKENPEALEALDHLLENGQMLNNPKGDPVDFGVSNLEELQSSAAKAKANQDEVQDDTQ
ncbi:MAG: hypothetical protein ACXVP2_13045 [Tumebacillaceae bacterium]